MTPLRGVLGTLIVVGLAWIGAGLFGDQSYPAGEEAMRRLAAGESREALARYRELQRERPDLRELDVNAGLAALRTGDTQRALLDLTAATRAAEPAVRSTAYYDRGNALFALGRFADARASWADSLRADPTRRDAKFNIEVADAIIDLVGPGDDASLPGASGQGQGRNPSAGQPGSSGQPQGPSGSSGAGQPGGGQQGGAGSSGAPNASGSQPPGVGQALIQFRRDKSIEDALLVLEALEAEQRGLEGLLEGAVPRRPATPGQGGAPLY